MSVRELFRLIVRFVGIGAALALLVVILVGDQRPLEDGAAAPPLRARLLDGSGAELDLRKGQITVVNIWATWCPPCMQELPDLVRVATQMQQTSGGRVRFVGLAADSPKADVEATVARFGIPYPIAQVDNRLLHDWNATMLPSTYIVDGTGIVRWSTRGAIDAALLESKLAPLLR